MFLFYPAFGGGGGGGGGGKMSIFDEIAVSVSSVFLEVIGHNYI